MAYDARKTFSDFERETGTIGRNLMQAVATAEELYQDLLVYRGTDTNAQIATALGVDEAWIDDLQSALVAMHQIYLFAENQSATTGNHFDALRKFT